MLLGWEYQQDLRLSPAGPDLEPSLLWDFGRVQWRRDGSEWCVLMERRLMTAWLMDLVDFRGEWLDVAEFEAASGFLMHPANSEIISRPPTVSQSFPR